MAIKKSDLYSTLWKSCDELRGVMDASQYKDYVLVMLFMKYISDKSKNDKNFAIEIPAGCYFDDLVALKNKANIGEEVSKILHKLAETNSQLYTTLTVADFNDETKLGKGKDLVTTVSNLIGVFQTSGLDFSSNRSDNDDLMGDAYEYLMKNFATESGKSKGQFYTPAEVSRVMAKVIGIRSAKNANETLYDPTCGSGSLLLKAQEEAPLGITIYGQEKDIATTGLATMNMILHGIEDAEIKNGNTITDPQFKEEADSTHLKTFDYIVANPPFSTKSWIGSAKIEDEFGRWGSRTGVPPEKNGDYAFLLHIIRSLKERGTGACILPHGVLFRGNAEYTIRKNIIKYIKGIIGLPANLFFGTGIPACILILDKREANSRKGIFMIDAKGGYVKDGAKNRLREQDIRRIVDTWEAHKDVPHYARFVDIDEIATKHDYNLNLPRYIQAPDTEVLQDIEAHLKGGIPLHDIEQMERYWLSCPTLKDELFSTDGSRNGYASLQVSKSEIRSAIESNVDYIQQSELFNKHFKEWIEDVETDLHSIDIVGKPKELAIKLGGSVLQHFTSDNLLVDGYSVYDAFMNYWNETLQDDAYMIAADGWRAELYVPQPAEKKDKNGEVKKSKRREARDVSDLMCDLLPVDVVIDYHFAAERQAIAEAQDQLSAAEATKSELEEEHRSEYLDEANFDGGKLTDQTLKKRINLLKKSAATDEFRVLCQYQECKAMISDIKKVIKLLNAELLEDVVKIYGSLTEGEVRTMTVNGKWINTLCTRFGEQMSQVSNKLTNSVVSLAERYETTLPEIDSRVTELEDKVMVHLNNMGFKL